MLQLWVLSGTKGDIHDSLLTSGQCYRQTALLIHIAGVGVSPRGGSPVLLKVAVIVELLLKLLSALNSPYSLSTAVCLEFLSSNEELRDVRRK